MITTLIILLILLIACGIWHLITEDRYKKKVEAYWKEMSIEKEPK